MDKINGQRKSTLLDNLLDTLQSKYVFPETAEKITEQINKNISSGAYDEMESLADLCGLLTEDLQEVSKDKHLIVEYSQQVLPEEEKDKKIDMWEPDKQTTEENNFGFLKVERLPGNIGYLDLRLFYPPYMAADTCHAAMAFLAKTNALILDLRQNGGGESDMVALLLSYFFPPKPVLLETFYFREGNRIQQSWTLPYLPGARYLEKPLYVLTSDKTFSGAEECAYDLQQLKRATLVGETTYGGAHTVDRYRLEDHVQVFVPNGRVINPVTGTDWEGVGVKPDIEVPAEEAFDYAYNSALQKLMDDVEQGTLKLTKRTLDEVKEELNERA